MLKFPFGLAAVVTLGRDSPPPSSMGSHPYGALHKKCVVSHGAASLPLRVPTESRVCNSTRSGSDAAPWLKDYFLCKAPYGIASINLTYFEAEAGIIRMRVSNCDFEGKGMKIKHFRGVLM